MDSLSDRKRFDDISLNLEEIRENIARAVAQSGRNADEVSLMAVTKTVDSRFINHAIGCGVNLIGENKVQEFLAKKPELNLTDCRSHLIGHLQTNKVSKIVGEVDLIQSVDSIRLAKEIGKRSALLGINSKVLIEINVGNEDSKFGFCLDEVAERAHEIAEIEGVCVEGLMCVAPICENESEIRTIFSNMHRTFIDIRSKNIDNINMNVLSMGMSADYIPAILEGSTLVRVGSAIFGARNYR